jgi:hypothetical protein
MEKRGSLRRRNRKLSYRRGKSPTEGCGCLGGKLDVIKLEGERGEGRREGDKRADIFGVGVGF